MLDPKGGSSKTRGGKDPLLWEWSSWSPGSLLTLDEAVTVERGQTDDTIREQKCEGQSTSGHSLLPE